MSKLELAMDHSSTPFNQQLTMKSSQEGTTRELGPDTLSKPIIHPEGRHEVEVTGDRVCCKRDRYKLKLSIM